MFALEELAADGMAVVVVGVAAALLAVVGVMMLRLFCLPACWRAASLSLSILCFSIRVYASCLAV